MKRITHLLIFAALISILLAACSAPLVVTETMEIPVTGQELVEVGQQSKPQPQTAADNLTYPIVDTGQVYCYDDSGSMICPEEGEAFYGQDAQYAGNQPSYTDHGDGTVTDNVTGLIWTQSADLNGDGVINVDDKLTYAEALVYVESLTVGGYTDWRVPTIKELYSLINFNGLDVSTGGSTENYPFIDDAFEFGYGDEAAGERMIDAQFVTTSIYSSTTMNGNQTMFGVNLADGRIKGYPTDKLFYAYFVRGSEDYGINDFVDNGDGTISDLATGLTWMHDDSGTGMDWESALNYCENSSLAGYTDWYLPNAKELQSIVDYSRSPDYTNSAAIDPLFNVSTITNEAGQLDYPMFWSSTTHASTRSAGSAAYVAFGRAMGNMFGGWVDVHGAGAQRSDPKSGDASQYSEGHGPQGDAVRIENYVRCVRSEVVTEADTGDQLDSRISGNPIGTDPGLGQVPGQEQLPITLQQSGPPQQAIDACSSLDADSACSFTTPQGTINGTCQTPQAQMICVPASGKPGG